MKIRIILGINSVSEVMIYHIYEEDEMSNKDEVTNIYLSIYTESDVKNYSLIWKWEECKDILIPVACI